jgi:hypothetical protein
VTTINIDTEAVATQLKIVADNIVRASLAIEEQDTIPAILQSMLDAIAGLMVVHALLFDEVPPWGPEEMRSELQQMLREKHSTN